VLIVFNVGSSSLRLTVFRGDAGAELAPVARVSVSGFGTSQISARGDLGGQPLELEADTVRAADHDAVLKPIWSSLARHGLSLDDVHAVGHRVVHGGDAFTDPVTIDAQTRARLGSLPALAPAHMPACLQVIDHACRAFPSAAHVACFDTAFHAHLPDTARRVPLPRSYEEKGYRRYGFHGLSCESALSALGKRLAVLPDRFILLHLGNGSSATAICEGRSIATTMGFSAVDGLVMGTRTGTLDPGLMLSLMRKEGLGPNELERLIYQESGLLALSGETSDMRALIASSSPRAAFAVEYYCYWAARHAGSLAVALGGLDAVAFTGGIGENAPSVRLRIAHYLRFLGVDIDANANATHRFDLSSSAASVRSYAVPADEELVIARHTLRLAGTRRAA
jgi:acetate kinase